MARGHAHALEGLLAAEALLQQGQHRHLLGGPLHAEAALFGQLDVGNIVGSFLGCNGHSLCFSY